MTEFVIFKNVKNLHIQEEKTMAKKILAILLALTFVFAFAACGGKTEDETTAPADTTVAEDVIDHGDHTHAAEVATTVANVVDHGDHTHVAGMIGFIR